MDARSLAMEMASIIMWQKGQKPDHYKQFWNNPPKADSNRNADSVLNYTEMDMLKGDLQFKHFIPVYAMYCFSSLSFVRCR